MSISAQASRLRPPRPPVPMKRPLRRVRHEVRDGVAVIAFSAVASTALAGAMLLVLTWVGQAA